MKHHKKAEGGSVNQEGPHEEETNEKKDEKMEHADEYKGKDRANREVKVEKKKGGAVHKRPERKRGGAVHGMKPKMRLDKRARGGSPKSPLSGADAPNLSYARGNLGVDDGGKGKTVKAD